MYSVKSRDKTFLSCNISFPVHTKSVVNLFGTVAYIWYAAVILSSYCPAQKNSSYNLKCPSPGNTINYSINSRCAVDCAYL